ncbi:uncharacterized protein METZ01_LOCUS427041, partial [marine metagenome]
MKINPKSSRTGFSCAWIIFGFFLLPSVLHSKTETYGEVFFEAKIRPVLLGRCVECHGPDKQKNGLRVDSLSALLKGGKSGPAIIPGKPDDSLLIHAVRRMDEDLKMPPKVPLDKHESDDLTTWIKNGPVWSSNSDVVIG